MTENIFSRLILLICAFAFVFLNVDAKQSTKDSMKELIGHQPFVIVCPPKCGTHLIGKTLSLILNKTPTYSLSKLGSTQESIESSESALKNGSFLVAHDFSKSVIERLVSKRYKIVFIARDPRDLVISVRNWLREGQWPWLEVSKIQDPQEQLTELITGAKTKWDCIERCFLKYEARVAGLSRKSLYTARFENLVGADGGGGLDRQVKEILGLAEFLEVTITNDEAHNIAHQLFGGTATFRKGQVGVWKTLFTEEQKKKFKSRYKIHLIRLGFEKDTNW
ncbi:MAG: sulfotransferase domain-containing protein [Parachlamydiaceae bacterium]